MYDVKNTMAPQPQSQDAAVVRAVHAVDDGAARLRTLEIVHDVAPPLLRHAVEEHEEGVGEPLEVGLVVHVQPVLDAVKVLHADPRIDEEDDAQKPDNMHQGGDGGQDGPEEDV